MFIDDLHLERMLHLKIVRSPYARARILKVEGGINGSEFKANLTSVGEGAWGGGGVSVPYPALASDYVSLRRRSPWLRFLRKIGTKPRI